MVRLVVQTDCTHNTTRICYSPTGMSLLLYCPHLPLFAYLSLREECQTKSALFVVALEKKSEGVQPIAVGCTLGKLVDKVADFPIVDEMTDLLSPRQLGYGVHGGGGG